MTLKQHKLTDLPGKLRSHATSLYRPDHPTALRLWEAASALEQSQKREKELVEAISAFVTKYDACSGAIDNAFQIAAIHGCEYYGPKIGEELAELRKSIDRVSNDQG